MSTPLSLASGIASLLCVYVLGIMALGATLGRPLFRVRAANIALAHLAGAVAATWLLTANAFLRGRLEVWPVFAAIVLLLPAGRRVKRFLGDTTSSQTEVDGPFTRTECLLIAATLFGLLALCLRWHFARLGWDAFAIWQLKAKAFFLDGNVEMLRGRTPFHYAHLDYPLLVPIQSWWTYAFIGQPDDRWARVIGVLFHLDLLAIFYGALRYWTARTPALTGLALVACQPILFHFASIGYADEALAAFLMTAGALLVRRCVDGDVAAGNALPWALGGLLLTKNEGLLATLGVLAIYWAYLRKPAWRGAAAATLLAALAYLPWYILKKRWYLTNDVLEDHVPAAITVTSFLQRTGYTLWVVMTKQWSRPGFAYPSGGLVMPLMIGGAVLALWGKIAHCRPMLILLALQAAGYMGIYLITPYEPKPHIDSSYDRLILHLFPLGLMMAAVAFYGPSSRRDQDAAVVANRPEQGVYAPTD